MVGCDDCDDAVFGYTSAIDFTEEREERSKESSSRGGGDSGLNVSVFFGRILVLYNTTNDTGESASTRALDLHMYGQATASVP